MTWLDFGGQKVKCEGHSRPKYVIAKPSTSTRSCRSPSPGFLAELVCSKLIYAMTEGLVSLQLFQPWQRLLQHAFDRRRRLLHLVQRTIGTSSALCCLVYPSRCVHMFWIRMYSIQVAWWRSGYSVGLAETPSSFPSTGQPPNCPFLWGNLDPHLTRSSLGPRW